MIYEYKVQYDSGGNITGYAYKIITGYTNDDIYNCDITTNVDCTISSTIDCDNSDDCTVDSTAVCTAISSGTVNLGPTPIYTTFTLVADGVTNDSQDLQGLIEAVAAENGGTIVLPSDTVISLKNHVDLNSDGTDNVRNYALTMSSGVNLKSFGGKCTLKADFSETEPASSILIISNDENVHIENIGFQGDDKTKAGIAVFSSERITITNCDFKDIVLPSSSISAPSVSANGVTQYKVEKCTFSNGEIGILVAGLSSDVYIENNVFKPSLTNNPIRISGVNETDQYTDGLWIKGNDIRVQRADEPYLDNPALNIQRYADGRVIWSNEYTNLVPKPIGISAINITCAPQEDSNGNIIKDSVHHQNVVVADNIAIGPDRGFYDGGSGDLFSLKDILRLKCYGNTSRNSGDLGFAIERCHFGSVANNTADRNNSCGISIFESTHINVTGNVCSDNELARDGAYLGNPYGGIRVEKSSIGILVEGNYNYANSGVKRSFVNGLATAPVGPETFYNKTGSPTQRYGVIVKNVWNDIPHNVKVGTNHTSGMLWGNDYSNVKASQMLNTYTGATTPTKGDYPLGTRLRNNLNVSSTASISEWQVVNHIRMKSVATSFTGSDTIRVKTLNSQNSQAHKLIENNDFTTILADDVIGIMTDKYNIHWAKVMNVNISPAIGANGVEIGEIQFIPALPENATYTVTSLTIGAQNEDVVDDKDVVCLRWEAL
ncbi:right-handed parallel beta-helix repeat-containing protein [uncultured Kordia sp.]|uniref:right-handed parallel beta-helix repeat-containing protein n=1 Tax=uncultured Kordia sp. TaxID=507699 RepID=UPI00262ADBC0|nr:right-handed parallel beta-helix repeat-containing protein [uncultured Kordia sp.]